MSGQASDAVSRAVVAAAARPGPWLAGLAVAWMVSGMAGPVAALLGGTTGFLGWLVAGLVLAPPALEVPPGAPALALPAPPPTPSGGPALPEGLRTRYQALHRSITQMAGHWPRDVAMPVDPARLTRIPEVFREQARLLAAMGDGAPGRGPLEERLADIEAEAARLRDAWSLLAAGPEQADEALEDVARAADQLEALLEA